VHETRELADADDPAGQVAHMRDAMERQEVMLADQRLRR
jgi:hypothetical protein